jgi:hypothetical protein
MTRQDLAGSVLKLLQVTYRNRHVACLDVEKCRGAVSTVSRCTEPWLVASSPYQRNRFRGSSVELFGLGLFTRGTR